MLTPLHAPDLQPLAIKKNLFSHLKPIRKSVHSSDHEVEANICNNITRWLCSFTHTVNSPSKPSLLNIFIIITCSVDQNKQLLCKSICESLANRLNLKPVKYNIQPFYFCVHLFRKHSFKEWKLGLLVQYKVSSMLPSTLFSRMKKRKYIRLQNNLQLC